MEQAVLLGLAVAAVLALAQADPYQLLLLTMAQAALPLQEAQPPGKNQGYS